METIRLSTEILRTKEGYLRIKEKIVLFDRDVFSLPPGLSLHFTNCLIIVEDYLEKGAMITTTASLVFMECEINGSITIQSLSEVNLNLSRKLGEIGQTLLLQKVKTTSSSTKIDINGNFENINIGTQDVSPSIDLSLFQATFKKANISGHFTNLQISLCRGNVLKLNCTWKSYFVLTGQGMKPEINNIIFTEETVNHLAKLLSRKKPSIPKDLNVKYIFHFLKKQQNIHGYQKLYNAYCNWRYRNALHLKKQKKISYRALFKDILYYKILKGFHSVTRMFFLCIAEIILFASLYYIIANFLPDSVGDIRVSPEVSIRSFSDMLYYSTITFTTVGYGDIRPHGIVRFFAAMEGFIGVFSILITSFVFTRSYGEFE